MVETANEDGAFAFGGDDGSYGSWDELTENEPDDANNVLSHQVGQITMYVAPEDEETKEPEKADGLDPARFMKEFVDKKADQSMLDKPTQHQLENSKRDVQGKG